MEDQSDRAFRSGNGIPPHLYKAVAEILARNLHPEIIDSFMEACLRESGLIKARAPNSRTRHKYIVKREGVNRIIETCRIDASGQLCPTEAEYAGCVSKYDEHGNKIEHAYFDADMNPCHNGYGVIRWRAEYDDLKREVAFTYLDFDARPCLGPHGHATRKTSYPESNKMEVTFFDTDGKPCPGPRGYPHIMFEYKANGCVKKQFYKGDDGQWHPLDTSGDYIPPPFEM